MELLFVPSVSHPLDPHFQISRHPSLPSRTSWRPHAAASQTLSSSLALPTILVCRHLKRSRKPTPFYQTRVNAVALSSEEGSAVDVAETDDDAPDATPLRQATKRLDFRAMKGMFQKWGGQALKMRSDGLGMRDDELAFDKQQKLVVETKWTPKRDNWEGYVTDNEGQSVFGPVLVSHEVDVLTRTKPAMEWAPGVVVGVASKVRQVPAEDGGFREEVVKEVTVRTTKGTTFKVIFGRGCLRRSEDARELCTDREIEDMAAFRSRRAPNELLVYAKTLETVASRSQALIFLSRMGKIGRRCAEELIEAQGVVAFSSVALREVAHSHARNGDLKAAIRHIDSFKEVAAAQLLLELLALGLTARILSEKEKLGVKLLRDIEVNEPIQEACRFVSDALPKLEAYASAVRALPAGNKRDGFVEAFNELLQSTGRAMAVPLAFRVMEWMEALSIPKDNFTYEAIGLNVVKRVSLLKKVWDLPQSPEDEICPEVVFAGRSNVGKSSLVNMLLNKKALAPTSQRPGKTKTMDFFDVNVGHPTLPRFRLVDVPGLGFARVSRSLRDRWIALIGGYFVQRKSLTIVFHLLDAGLQEIMPADRELWRLLAQAQREDFALCIALTKADGTNPSQLERFAGIVRKALQQEGSEVTKKATIFACSAKSRLGKDTLWRKIWGSVGGNLAWADYVGPGPKDTEKYRHEEFRFEGDGVDRYS